MRTILSIAAAVFAFAAAAHADIFQWEYINPADPSQGKRQSTTLCPSGAGVDAVPGASLSHRNLTMAYLIGMDLNRLNALHTDLTDADLSGSDLTGANFGKFGSGFRPAILTGANFTGADLRGANFTGIDLHDANFTAADIRGAQFHMDIFVEGWYPGSGISLAQLYSTASYAAHDLSGIGLGDNYLSGANLSAQNLTGAYLGYADLTGADFTNAEVRGASFAGTIGGSRVGGFTLAQLYSTASYADHDLSGILLYDNDLSGANLSGQNLTGANLNANLTGADFTAADVRGAFLPSFPANAITTNLIRRDGHIHSLDLDAGGLLVVRDHDGNPRDPWGWPVPPIPIPITIDQHLAMGPGGTLRMVFEADAWDSNISFAPGIPVTLGGTLELTFADNVNLASQLGRTFDLFDWTGVTPTGVFAISSP
jgi:uncharacterized protein YjbI with pentapeptide repeats